MSEGDVSLIRDEDVLRRMWQQTEDFSRKKEIRAHMYRLREERLRNLYSPEPPAPAHSPGKGVEQTHVAALADQSFQRLKRKEVRDAGSPSPPRDLSRGTLPAELRELSNAGWNVESENRTTDDGHTQVRAVTANIEGRYDVEGGRGQFTALDQQRRARTEYHDDHSSLQRDESASNTAHREQVVRKTDDGTEFTSTATSSNSTSKVEQYSSTHEVPYVTNDDYNLAQDSTNRKDYTKVTKTNDYEQNLRRNEYESGELVSRKVDYPDDNTKVIVETRCLPDGTRVTSTRREFRAPVQSTRSEQHSARSESKSYSTSSHHKSDVRESTKNIREFDTRTRDIVDSQKHADDYDFKKNESDHLTQTDNYSVIQQKNQQTSNDKRFDTKESSSKIIRETVDSRSDIVDTQSNLDDYEFKRIHRPDHLVKKDDVTTNERKNTRYETKTNESDRYESTTSSDIKINKNTDHSTHEDNISTQRINRHETKVDETDRREFTTFVDDQNVPRNVKEVHNVRDSEERVHKVTRDKKVEEVLEKKTTSDQYQTTYQTDFTQKKISTDWSPTHQAWASTLRADTPSSTRPTTRASSPGSKTYQSSTSSLRSSVSPDKTTRKPTSRGGSPSKVDRYSPSRLSTERYSSTHSTHSVTENKTDRFNSPDRKPPSGQFSASPDRKVDGYQKRPSQSPEKRPQNSHRSSASPETKPGYKSSPSEEYPRTYSPSRPKARSPSRSSVSPQRKPEYQPSNGKSTPDSGYPRTTSPYRSTISPEKKVPEHPKNISQSRPSISPDRKPGHQQPSPTRTSPEKTHPFNESPKRPSVSPDRKPGYMRSTAVSTPFERPSSERKSPAKHVPSQSPEQKPYNKITQAKEDHYKFIDEETKMYTRIDREDVDVTKKTTSPSPDRYSTPHDKSPSPTKNSPEDTTDNRCESPSILRKGSRSPSPPKGPVTFTQDKVDKSKSTVTNVTTKYDYQNVINKHTSPRHETDSNDVKYDTLTRQNKTTTKVSDIPASHPKKSQRDSVSPTKYPDSPREPSPSKFGTYDKKRQTEEVKNITVTTKDSSDVYYDSTLTRQNKNTTKEYDIPASPTKKSPRDSVSPTKYPDSPREPSPSKFGTYDKKRQTDEVENRTVTTKNSSEVKYDSLTRKNKTTIKESDLPATSTKKAPGVSVSPSKCPDSPREPSPSKYKKQTNTEELEKVLTTTVEDRTDIKFDSLTRRHKTDSSRPDSPSSPVKKAPRDSVSSTKTLNTPRELSPSKYGTYDKKQYQTDEVEEVITTTKKDTTDVEYDSLKRRKQVSRPRQEPDVPSSPSKKSPRDSVSPTKTPGSIRDPSPTKYGTYDKNQYRTEELKEVTTTSTTQDTTDVKYDSLTRRQKTSSSKPDLPSSPTKKFPTESASPVKSPTKDAKYKHTADFITTETMTEEINKKSTKDRPRQLVTPSTSPTRKPKPSDTAPSSGQSSPTTSVSGFVYFGSPQTNRNIVTDLDDYEYHTETNTTTTSNIRHTRPETLNVERSPSPSKIPCKSPTSEKKVSPVKETLPRKSSLKKPPTDFNLTSPVEKPPSSFRVSPTDDRKQFPEHKIVKKDHADKPLDSPIKQKPPFERRETYEERCLKILGVIDDDTKQVTKTEKEPNSNLSSPSVSPCPSPELKEQLPFKNVDTQNTTKIQVTDFITREQEDTIKKTTTRREDMITTDRKTMKPTRESSPTKLQDIITTSKYDKTTTEELHEDNITKTVRQSPDRDIGYRKPHEDKQSPDLKSSRTSPNRSSLSPEKTPEQPKEGTASEYPPTKSPSKPHAKDVRSRLSPERKYGYQQPTSPSIPEKGSAEKYPKQSVPTRSSVSPDRKPDYIQTTASTTTQREDTSTVKDIHIETTSTSVKQSLDRETGYQKPKDRKSDSTSVYPRPTSPDKTKKGKSPDSKPGYEAPSSVLENNLPGIKPTDKTSSRPSSSPEKPGYMKPTAATVTKFDETTIEKRDVVTSKIVEKTHPTSPQQPSSKKHEEPKHSRTPSPTKTVKKATEDISEFIMFEREQEVLDRVQQSLRKLSPNREQKSPSREKSPGKTTISLQDIDVVATETSQTDDEDDFEITENETTTRTVTRIGKPKEQKSATKTFSRTVSPTKKPVSTAPSKTDKNPESPNKSRSISPKKAVSPTERPRSPQVPKASGIKQREPIPSNLTRKPSSTSPTKTEKISIEVKKTTGFTKQNSFTKTSTVKTTASKFISTPNKTEPETKRAPTPKGINKENVSPKKEDTKVTRTPSDISLKIKKPSPQRMRSKPEIQVNDVSTAKTTKTTTTTTRKATKEPQTKLAPKPKSATALNTSTDEDDIIIDVELAKSSRENSPDRICPTPVNFGDDVGTPRLPDEVSEPDDDFRNRTHHTIHETESIVDDIVEICEDDELFVKRTDVDRITESDECLLSVTDKVSKFTNKIENVTKPKESTMQFKDTERRVHSDFIKEDLKSDECLLTVSEKVNKFAKGTRDSKDKSPSRRITDEYDTDTVYQDDYTKLSVNDKAHLFIETAENVKTPKSKPTQPIERPDLSNIDESLKSDDCLLSVSDKVNKFVKTTEHFLTESHEVDEKEKKVREEYEKFIKHIVEDSEEDAYESKKTVITKEVSDRKLPDEKKPSFAKETSTSHAKVKDYSSPNLKPTERIPTVKITTLRSSEAVKKAKALFENIASTTQKTKDTKTTTLMDIGVIKKSPKTDSTTVLHPSVEDSLNVTETDSEVDAPYTPTTKDRPSSGTLTRPRQPAYSEDKPRSPIRLSTQSPEVPRNKSPMRHTTATTTPKKTVLSRYPAAQTEPKQVRPDINKEIPQDKTPKQPSTNDTKQLHPESEKPQEKIPSYQRPTKTSQIKEEKTIEEAEVSSRRGSGKFGVELRRTSVERSTLSSERRRSSDHHQPCIEDIFDLDLLEQMLEKVVGYEQRRRIRSQIRVAKKRMETEHYESNNYLKTTKQTIKSRSPEPRHFHKYPETQKPPTNTHEGHSRFTPQKSTPSVHTQPKEQSKPLLNGHAKEPSNLSEKRQRPQSPEKPKSVPIKTRSPVRRPSPEKKTRTTSPTKTTPKPKSNRFSEYATAYMKKVGLEADKLKVSDKTRKDSDDVDHKTERTTTKKTTDIDDQVTVNRFETKTEIKSSTMSKSFSGRTSSKDTIEIVQLNGKRSPSPEKRRSPERRVQSPGERLHQRTPSPDFKRRTDKETIVKNVYETNQPGRVKETIIKTVYEERPRVETTRQETTVTTAYDIETKIQPKTAYVLEKKVQPKTAQEDKPSWVTNRNLKKPNEPRTFPTKRAEDRARPARPGSPARTLARPTDVITSSYGPGPLDADGRPLFGIKALRNGASNYQVKGTVVRQEFHSRNGGEPEGSVSVTAYSTEPQDLERLLQAQGERPSRIHGLAAITTTKRFGGDSGASIRDAQTREERAALEQFTHSDRRVEDSLQVTEVTGVDDALVDSRTIEDRSMRTDDRSVRADERGVRNEDRRERVDRREDKKTVRQSSVKSLTEKYIKSASDTLKSERCVYPKAGLILRTANMRDSVSSDSSAHAGLARTDSEHSLGSVEEHAAVTTRVVDGHRATATATTTRHTPDSRRTTVTTTRHAPDSHRTTTVTTTRHAPETHRTVTTRNAPDGQRTVTTRTTATTERSFLDSNSKVTGVQDILTRMKNADIVVQEGDSSEDAEARALLNKFLGATVLMAGMQGYVADQPGGGSVLKQQETVRSSGVTSARAEQIDPEHCWDERVLRKLLDECTDYEQRRRLRARLRTLMAEQEACASAVTEALAAAGEAPEPAEATDAREEEEVTVSSSVRRNSSEKTVSSSTITRTSKVIESATRPAPKPVSPFAKFRQLEKQNSTNSPNSPKTPQSPGSQPYFKFTDPALQASALTIKERLLQWCRDKTRDYENVKLENFSTSWADGLAFCALLHHFLPDAFDYSQLTADKRRHNFTLAFKIADEKAGIYPLLDVDDMVTMRRPDWKCVFTYVQAIHRRFKDQS